MRALSLHQPWATLVAIGAKKIETRSWSMPFRGRLAIHASKKMPIAAAESLAENAALSGGVRLADILRRAGYRSLESLPTGKILATAELYDCIPTDTIGFWDTVDISQNEGQFGDFSDGRFAWMLRDVRELAVPVACRGALGLWTVPADLWVD